MVRSRFLSFASTNSVAATRPTSPASSTDYGRTDAGEPLSAQVLATPMGDGTVSCAPSQKPASFWRQFVFPGALIPKADATLALRLILD